MRLRAGGQFRLTQHFHAFPHFHLLIAKPQGDAVKFANRRKRLDGGFVMTETKVRLDVFEGPLDLLLYLVKKEEVDIYEVNLTKIATQFIEYLELMRQLDLDVAGEFLVMASTLMYIKSRELLPVDQQAVVDGEDEDEIDPRWELIRQLVEYKKFKDAAGRLHERELVQENIFTRLPAKLEFAAPPGRPEVSLFDLITAVSNIVRRYGQRSEIRDVFEDK